MPDDYYVSQYSGEEIDERLTAAHNAVRYDAAQTLTDAQKTQARANIAAAPDGFGLGGSATLLTPSDNLDTLMKNGWFYYNTSNAPQGTLPSALASCATLVHVSAAGDTCVQEAYDSTDSGLHGTVLRRTVYGVGTGAKIYPWEYENPPMLLGIEYRTTERYLGKPVYKKMIAYTGALTADYSQMSHNIANIDAVCGCYAELFVSSTRLSTPRFDGGNFIVFSASQSVIIKQSNSDYSSYSARVTLSYTKSTD